MTIAMLFMTEPCHIGFGRIISIRSATAAEKRASSRYSLFMKVSAPSFINVETLMISSFSILCLFTQR